jgi:hypothetical protein
LDVVHADESTETIDLWRFPHVRSAHAISIREARHAPAKSRLLIEVSTPQHAWSAALLAAIAAEKEANQRRDQVREALKRDLEAARYATDRDFRQYDAADPANRLVAGELEARWNKALARMAEVEGKIAAYDAAKVAPVAEPASLATLAEDLRAVWAAPRLMHGSRSVSYAPSFMR